MKSRGKPPQHPVGAAGSGLWGTFALLDELREDDHLSPSKFIEVMHLNVSTFARNAKVHRKTVARAPTTPGVQGHLLQGSQTVGHSNHSAAQALPGKGDA